MMIQAFCPSCLSNSARKKFIATSQTYTDVKPIKLTVNICDTCKAYYLGEFVDEESIGEYYPSTYYTKAQVIDISSFSFRVRHLSYKLFKGYPFKYKLSITTFLSSVLYGIFFWHRWSRFPKYLEYDKKRTALEVGYGAGRYLMDLNALGWECAGIDIEQSNAEALKNLGISVASSFELLDLDKASIDYIYSYHAFEHIYDIDSAMSNCHSMLSKDGVFKFCVPISDGLLPKIFKKYWYDLGVPIHKQIFSIRGVHLLCKRHGFQVKSYKYNSYSESFIGSLIALIIGLKQDDSRAAQDYTHNKIFKIMCCLVSPIVFFLDLIQFGDRAEFVLIKK
ncbi:class I SAM-dependent methyltransferase [Gammaproteobacteria bacterium]|nr:class I SAM-dependent methyltransferase [Gammaproteobacteria bacterium]